MHTIDNSVALYHHKKPTDMLWVEQKQATKTRGSYIIHGCRCLAVYPRVGIERCTPPVNRPILNNHALDANCEMTHAGDNGTSDSAFTCSFKLLLESPTALAAVGLTDRLFGAGKSHGTYGETGTVPAWVRGVGSLEKGRGFCFFDHQQRPAHPSLFCFVSRKAKFTGQFRRNSV